MVTVRPFAKEDRAGCAAVLAGLPHWFGFAAVNDGWIAELAPDSAFVAASGGQVTGFVMVTERTAAAAEIPVLALVERFHRHGTGRALVERAEDLARVWGKALLYALTLGPSHPDAGYASTRAFWQAMGYLPLFETPALWGPDQPALVMVKPLGEEDRQ